MRALALEISHLKVGSYHNNDLDKATRDALALYVRGRWPFHTAKMASREWDLSLDEARGLVAARTSLSTMDRIWKHKNGGWSVLLPVMGAVIGESLDQHIQKQREDHAQQDRRRDALLRDLRTGRNPRSLAGY